MVGAPPQKTSPHGVTINFHNPEINLKLLAIKGIILQFIWNNCMAVVQGRQTLQT